jgi:hypothetical protein
MRQKEFFYANGIFTAPSNVNYVTIEAWGAGGTGGLSTRFGGRGGGGSGGAYAKKFNYPVTPGQTYTVTVGQGGAGNRDSWFDNTNVVLARGGINGNNATGATPAFATGASGSTAGCVGDIIFKGGNGGNGVDAGSGGGGGGAGSTNSGSNAVSNVGGSATNFYGGLGANGVTPGNNGNPGASFGGGGSGGANTDLGSSTRNGGIGGNGLVIVTYSTQNPSFTLYSDCCDLEVGCFVYTNPSLTTIADAGTYYDGTNCLLVNDSGVITDLGSCTPVAHCLARTDPSFLGDGDTPIFAPGITQSNCETACTTHLIYNSCFQNVLIYADQTGSFKYTACDGTIAYGLIPSNTPIGPISEKYEYTVTGPCIRFNSITTDNILPPIQPPAEIFSINYVNGYPNICGSWSNPCGC